MIPRPLMTFLARSCDAFSKINIEFCHEHYCWLAVDAIVVVAHLHYSNPLRTGQMTMNEAERDFIEIASFCQQ
jgi:hypothetical protein